MASSPPSRPPPSSFPSSSTPEDLADNYPMQNDDKYEYGRIDPSRDESVNLFEAVSSEGLQGGDSRLWNSLPLDDSEINVVLKTKASSSADMAVVKPTQNILLLTLPSELIKHIFTFLSPTDLVAMSSTCCLLHKHSSFDLYWQRYVQENIPGVTLTSPYPFSSYRELYIAHDPHWFLTKYKIWFCDYYLTGKIIITRYDPRRGCIDGYCLVAERPATTFEPWEADDEVIIHSFNPRCRLHMDEPVLHLDALSLESLILPSGQTKPDHRFYTETPMRINKGNNNAIFSNFLLTRPIEERPNMQLWPPATIPARHRVRNASQEAFVGMGHKPQKRSEVSDQAFRIRRWMEMHGGHHSPGVHLGEEVCTYATLDPKLYTPTEEKPWRGIWAGDYSGWGVEFLLMHQPDSEPFDESKVVQKDDETIEEWEARKKEERVFRGSLEAIKLTGDPNIPRGEYTFVADDIGKVGYIRTATEKKFRGARIVKSRGHIAESYFRNDKYIESQLIMISPNRLAQYWVGCGHISFYERVDIDAFLSPYHNNLNSPEC